MKHVMAQQKIRRLVLMATASALAGGALVGASSDPLPRACLRDVDLRSAAGASPRAAFVAPPLHFERYAAEPEDSDSDSDKNEDWYRRRRGVPIAAVREKVVQFKTSMWSGLRRLSVAVSAHEVTVIDVRPSPRSGTSGAADWQSVGEEAVVAESTEETDSARVGRCAEHTGSFGEMATADSSDVLDVTY